MTDKERLKKIDVMVNKLRLIQDEAYALEDDDGDSAGFDIQQAVESLHRIK